MSHEIIGFLLGAFILTYGAHHNANAKQERLAETWHEDRLPLRPYDHQTDGL